VPVAKELRDRDGARALTAHGTLYNALGRMQAAAAFRAATPTEWRPSPGIAPAFPPTCPGGEAPRRTQREEPT
jgi:hypothetical protein